MLFPEPQSRFLLCVVMQAEDRAHRIGQKREVLVLVLVSAGTIEQVILDRAQQKKEIDAKVIQAGYHFCRKLLLTLRSMPI